jgi:hypothetical protein
MYKFTVTLSKKWPWVSFSKTPSETLARSGEPVPPVEVRVLVNKYPPVVVLLGDDYGSTYGVIHHLKVDGKFGVRPVDDQGNFFPNRSEHWSPEQRAAIPHEISVSYKELRAVTEYPGWAR